MKWFVEEPGSDLAAELQAGLFELIAPTILQFELAHGLRRRVARAATDLAEARMIIDRLDTLPVTLLSTTGLLPEAFDFALRFNRGVYDSLYAVLALRHRCRCLTADRKLYDATAGAFPETMVFIDQIPELLV